MNRYRITYEWRGKIRHFYTRACCDQIAIWHYSKDKALKDAKIINCEVIGCQN